MFACAAEQMPNKMKRQMVFTVNNCMKQIRLDERLTLIDSGRGLFWVFPNADFQRGHRTGVDHDFHSRLNARSHAA